MDSLTHLIRSVLLLSLLLLIDYTRAQTLLFNGGQIALFSDAPTECLAAFNTSLDCSESVQLLGYDLQALAWSEEDLTLLCTEQCSLSMQALASEVSSACTEYMFTFNSLDTTATQIVDLFYFKYNYSCLSNAETGQYCMMEELEWNITELNNSGMATWPTYTNKTYPNLIENDDGSPLLDWDETVIENPFADIPPFNYLNSTFAPTGTDYYTMESSDDYSNYGWPFQLEYDEYPLEIQCQPCFIDQFIMGIESQWGEVYDEVTSQFWANWKNNCNLTRALNPAHNLTGGLNGDGPLIYTTRICDYNITVKENNSTCTSVALAASIESASLWKLNPVYCNMVGPGTYCTTESCQIVEITERTSADALLFAAEYSNITMTQFASWNPFTSMGDLREGDTVCVGPPGGAYVPVLMPISQTNQTVSTTATSSP